MGLSSALEWWDEWQLRILVLGSLTVQYLLAIFAGGRKLNVPQWYRFFIWLSYLGSDALVIYALATLFNRQKNMWHNSAHVNRDLEVFWVPILLTNLGGQWFMTAYNIEDNELWRRYIVTALSQVTVAIYVFWNSWSISADKRLLSAAILLFIYGILKCFEKPWALKGANFNSLVNSSETIKRTTITKREEELETYVQKARRLVQQNNPPLTVGDENSSHLRKLTMPKKLFLDFAYPYDVRHDNLKSFWMLDDATSYQALKLGLSKIFNLLYTKEKVEEDITGPLCGLGFYLQVSAIGLFHSSHKGAYNSSDVIISLVMLYGTFMLEILSLGVKVFFEEQWPTMVAQRRLIGYFAYNKRNNKLMSFTRRLGCKEVLDQYWNPEKPCYSSKEITILIRGYVKDGWMKYIEDAESYMKFMDTRGQWTLERGKWDQHLSWSLEKPFDESILLWHMATDFCLHLKGFDNQFANQCREISNYMIHLLFDNPEMLMAGSRRNLFVDAYDELESMLQGENLQSADEEKLMEKIIEKAKYTEGFVNDAWLLAEGFMDLGDEKMWEVIKDVWVEMLCFSAARSRGYLHAKWLGAGGEYLSYVWLLWAHAGMETFPERQQRVQLKLPKETRVAIVKKKIEEAECKEGVGPFFGLEVAISHE